MLLALCLGATAGKLKKLSPVQATGDSRPPSTRLSKEYRLHIIDRNTHIKFLIDSGSVISLIPVSIIKGLHRRKDDFKLYAANTSIIDTYGTLNLTFGLNLRRNFTWSFVVANVQSAIIGADFLTHHGLILDLKGKRLMDPSKAVSTKGEVAEAKLYNVSTINVQSSSGIDRPYSNLLSRFVQITRPNVPLATRIHNEVAHCIQTTGPPVFDKPRRLTGEKLKAARRDFDLLLQQGVIRPSSSQWASPIHLVPKGSNEWRTTGDYRKLNASTIPDRYPIPHGEDILQRLHGCSVFSTIDLVRAYHQIPVAPDDIPKTAVTTPFGLFEFVGMPPGLRNAAQTFQRHMDNLLRGIPFVGCYMDDIIVFSTTHEEHLKHLQTIFEILQRNHLQINPKKCQFGKSEVIFLGFQVNASGFKPPVERTQAINNFPKPQTIMELRRFLGMVNYYRHLIPNAAQAQIPLTDYLKGATKNDKREIAWTGPAESAFQACKQGILRATCSSFLSPSAHLALKTDASDTAIGAALEQLVGNIWRPIGFFSRKLSPAEQGYSTYDRELLAIFAGIIHFKHILEGRPFIIQTDHKPLQYAFRQKASKASPRQLRQLDFISQFSTEIVYNPGENNAVADALSRINTISMPSSFSAQAIFEAQQTDDEMAELSQTTSLGLQVRNIDNLDIWCDISGGRERPYLPKSLRRQAFDAVHGLAHPSGRTTAKLLKQRFVWPAINRDATLWSRQCVPCQRAKIHRKIRAHSLRSD